MEGREDGEHVNEHGEKQQAHESWNQASDDLTRARIGREVGDQHPGNQWQTDRCPHQNFANVLATDTKHVGDLPRPGELAPTDFVESQTVVQGDDEEQHAGGYQHCRSAVQHG